jgi:hypothetical protein
LLTADTNAIILTHTVPPEGDQIVGDPAAVTGLFKEFNEWYRLYVQHLGTVADKAIDLNKDIAAFHERLLLVNIGTIGISLSALISLGGRIAGNLTARHILVWYVAPAWVLLFLSVGLCRNVMAFALRINKAILTDWMKRLESYHLQQVARSVTKLSAALHGTVTIGSTPQNVSTIFADLAKALQEQVANDQQALLAAVTKADALQLKWQSRAAGWVMLIALILLCAAAIKLFLL